MFKFSSQYVEVLYHYNVDECYVSISFITTDCSLVLVLFTIYMFRLKFLLLCTVM